MSTQSSNAPSVRILGEGRFLRLVNADGWEYVERSCGTDVVAVIAVTHDARLLLTEQDRPAVRRRVIDLPAGLAGDGDAVAEETLEAAAARELEEETGFAAPSLRPLATMPTSPGLAAEIVTLFLAEKVHRIGGGGGDASESITVHPVPLAGIEGWLAQQASAAKLIDPKIYAALWLYERSTSRFGEFPSSEAAR